jgi:hypothetical protein
MRRAIVMAAALAVIPIAPAATAGSVGAQQCTQRLNYRTARYKAVATRAHVPVARRLGRGALIGCTITRATAREGGVRRVSVYAVRGVRPEVAVALRPERPALFLSSATPTAAERRALDRIRGR